MIWAEINNIAIIGRIKLQDGVQFAPEAHSQIWP